MKRILMAALYSAIAAAAASAQTGQGAQSQEAKDKQPLVTVTGCLRTGEEPNTFVLSNVKWLSKSTEETKSKPPEVAGTSGTDAGASGATLRLVGSASGVRMSEHVGHMVEVTGTIIDEAAPKPSGDPAANLPQAATTAAEQNPPATSPPQPPAPKAEHTINVRTLRMIGENCSPKN